MNWPTNTSISRAILLTWLEKRNEKGKNSINRNISILQKFSPAAVLCGATDWWGGGRRSAATGGAHSPQALMSLAAGQPPAPSGHTEPAGTRPQTLCDASYRTGGVRGRMLISCQS